MPDTGLGVIKLNAHEAKSYLLTPKPKQEKKEVHVLKQETQNTKQLELFKILQA